VVATNELFGAVDAAFAITGRGLAPWPDPHPDRSPPDDQYSRLTDPAKWRIVGARADAWLTALVDVGLAEAEADAPIRWREPPRTVVARTYRVAPRCDGALPLIVARSGLGSVEDAGVTLGAGDPAVCIAWIPDCGCDACDSGSQDALDELDEYVFSVVSGAFRRLSAGGREITVFGGGRRAAGGFGRGEVDAILANPSGWNEVSGTSWLGDDRRGPTPHK
jgi:Family of unknown function (DUF6226)